MLKRLIQTDASKTTVLIAMRLPRTNRSPQNLPFCGIRIMKHQVYNTVSSPKANPNLTYTNAKKANHKGDSHNCHRR